MGLVDAKVVRPDNVTVTAGHAERVAELTRTLGVRGAASNAEAARGARVVFLSVKPQTVPSVLADLKGVLEPSQLLVSVAASVGTAFIEKHLDRPVPVIRAMPNTPALIRHGKTGLAAGRNATREHLEAALRLFRPIGRTVLVDEKHMDAVTALSASGPAFIDIVIESLAEGGVKVGLPPTWRPSWPHRPCSARARWCPRAGSTRPGSRLWSPRPPAAPSTPSSSSRRAA